jgi:hypothetical protein
VLDVDMEVTDLLFIDTLHVYGQLKRELAKHATNVKWRIVLHDTTIDGVGGQFVRFPKMFRSIEHQLTTVQKWTREDTRSGLMRAVHEFLDAHPDEWVLVDQWTHNNGLTILQRIPGTFGRASAGGGGGVSSDVPSDAAVVGQHDGPVTVGAKRATPDATMLEKETARPLLAKDEEDAALP